MALIPAAKIAPRFLDSPDPELFTQGTVYARFEMTTV
jgi:hypothetical protein